MTFQMDLAELSGWGENTKPMGAVKVFERIFRGSMLRLYENTQVSLDTYISKGLG